MAGALRIELRPSDLESLALTTTLYPEVIKTPRPWAWSFKNVALKIAARAFLTFYIYYIIKFIKSQNKNGAGSGTRTHAGKADGLQDRSNRPLWDSCIMEVLLRFELKFEHYEYPVLDHYTIEPHYI